MKILKKHKNIELIEFIQNKYCVRKTFKFLGFKWFKFYNLVAKQYSLLEKELVDDQTVSTYENAQLIFDINTMVEKKYNEEFGKLKLVS